MRPIDADALYESLEKVYEHPDSMLRDSAWWFFGKLEDAPTIAPPPNDPLTLEELREMDGEPVWCVSNAHDIVRINCWAIISADLERCAGNTVWLNFEDYGTWLAYRRRPEEGAK